MVHRVILRTGASQLDRYDVALSTVSRHDEFVFHAGPLLPPSRIHSISDEELPLPYSTRYYALRSSFSRVYGQRGSLLREELVHIYIYMCVYTRDGDLRVGDSIYTDFGRHQFGITARETRDTTSKTARHATARFSTRETRPRFRGHPAPMYHRDTIELELPEIIPSYYRGVVISRRTTLRVYPDPLYFTY